MLSVSVMSEFWTTMGIRQNWKHLFITNGLCSVFNLQETLPRPTRNLSRIQLIHIEERSLSAGLRKRPTQASPRMARHGNGHMKHDPVDIFFKMLRLVGWWFYDLQWLAKVGWLLRKCWRDYCESQPKIWRFPAFVLSWGFAKWIELVCWWSKVKPYFLRFGFTTLPAFSPKLYARLHNVSTTVWCYNDQGRTKYSTKPWGQHRVFCRWKLLLEKETFPGYFLTYVGWRSARSIEHTSCVSELKEPAYSKSRHEPAGCKEKTEWNSML